MEVVDDDEKSAAQVSSEEEDYDVKISKLMKRSGSRSSRPKRKQKAPSKSVEEAKASAPSPLPSSDSGRSKSSRTRKKVKGFIENPREITATAREMSGHLDYLIAFGNDIIVAAHKRNNWIAQRNLSMSMLDSLSAGASSTLKNKSEECEGLQSQEAPEEKSRDIKRMRRIENLRKVHAEDTVIYSKLKSVKYMNDESGQQHSQTKNMADTSLFQWPMDFNEYYSLQQEQHKKKSKEGWIETKCSSDVDKEWRNYFGDGIDPQEFLQRRSRKRSHAKISSMGSDSIAQGNDHKRRSKLALQEFIQRAWDKAVHIASNTIEISPVDDATRLSQNSASLMTMETQRNREEEMTQRPRRQQDRYALRCKQLGIHFDPIYIDDDDPYYTCQSCKKRIKFVSNEKVMEHLFGSSETKACCRGLIEKKEEDILYGSVEKEAMNLIDNLLHIVFKKFKGVGLQEDKTINWINICDAMKETLSDPSNVSNISEGSKRAGEETFQAQPNMSPFPLNEDLIKVAVSRLIERYDDTCTPN